MKIAKIKSPPGFPKGKPIDFPAWIGESCIGLCLAVAEFKIGGDLIHVLARSGECPCDEHYLILPDDLIRELRLQEPQQRSREAAEWIDENDFWAGPLGIGKDVLEIDEVPVPLEAFRARCKMEFTLIIGQEAYEEGVLHRLPFRCGMNYDPDHSSMILLFGRHKESYLKKFAYCLGNFSVRNVTGCYHPALPFWPETI